MPEWLRINFTHLSGRFALASFCLFAGMAIAHWGARLMGPSGSDTALQMDVLGSPTTRVRDIQPAENGRVRIIVDRSQQQELVGAASDGDIRIMLLAAARNSADPGLRIDSVDLLRQQRGDDIREVLLSAVRHDENAAVRLKALDALRAFPADQTIRQALVSVLQHDGDPGVRAEAINVLLPPDQPAAVTPDLLRILQAISVSGHSDDYLRSRSVQVLRASGSPDVY